MSTGERIAQLAKARNMSLHKLAELSGVSYNTLYSAMRRKSDRVDSRTLEKVARVLGVDVSVILSGEQLAYTVAVDMLKDCPEMDTIDILIRVICNQLTHSGRLALLKYADDLFHKPEYRKSMQSPESEE